MPNLGPLELGIIFLIILVIFGPKSLPRVGSALGRGIREFKNAARGLTSDLEDDERRRAELPNQPSPGATPEPAGNTPVIDSPAHKS